MITLHSCLLNLLQAISTRVESAHNNDNFIWTINWKCNTILRFFNWGVKLWIKGKDHSLTQYPWLTWIFYCIVFVPVAYLYFSFCVFLFSFLFQLLNKPPADRWCKLVFHNCMLQFQCRRCLTFTLLQFVGRIHHLFATYTHWWNWAHPVSVHSLH